MTPSRWYSNQITILLPDFIDLDFFLSKKKAIVKKYNQYKQLFSYLPFPGPSKQEQMKLFPWSNPFAWPAS